MDRIIKVTGKGKISVKPNTIRLNIEAEGVYKEYEQAVKKSAEATGILRETLEKAGLKAEELKTVHFDIDSEYERYRDKNDDYRSRFVGYKYTHSMYIQFSNDNKQLGRVLYELAHCNVKVEFSIRYTVKDADAVKNELLVNAVENSKFKANVLVKAAGVSLGEIKSIDFSWGEIKIFSKPLNLGSRDMLLAEAEPKAYDIDIEADDIDVQDTVTIVWEIK